MTASQAVKSHERGMDGTGCGADASSMFRFKKGDNPETPALRPSQCLRVGVAGNGAPPAPLLPGVWQECGTDLTVAKVHRKSSGLVK
jgi:hypothetical protein